MNFKPQKIALLAAALLCSVTAFAITVPQPVMEAFAKRFPNATTVSWGKENAHEYEAEFTMNGKKCSANFKDDASWVETETDVAFTALPRPVQEAYNAQHKAGTIKAASSIETATGTWKYEVEYMDGTHRKEAVYGANGRLLK